MACQRWFTTSGRRRRSGSGCRRCWEGRGLMLGCQDFSTLWWCRWYFCMGRRRGLCIHTLGGGWEDPTPGWYTVWQDGIWGRVRMGHWFNPNWWRRWWRQVYRRWISMSPSTRTQSHNILRPCPLWTCIWRRSDAWVRGYWSGGGIGINLTWRGYIRRLGQRNCKDVEYIEDYAAGYCSVFNNIGTEPSCTTHF